MSKLWELHFYPDHSGIGEPPTDPGDPEQRKESMLFLLACDAECTYCGYVQHPPTGGKCPKCCLEGEIDYETIKVEVE